MTRLKDNRVFADPCLVADSFLSRLKGLMGKSFLPTGSGLLIRPCNSIHTFFMKFAIDVVYLGHADAYYQVVAVRRAMKPWRMDFPVSGAAAVLELPQGAAGDLTKGDVLCLS